jgi:hypothetical protein
MQSRLHRLRIAGFFHPPIPAPLVHRSSSRHRSDCVRYHSGSLGLRDSFPDIKDAAVKKDECEQF